VKTTYEEGTEHGDMHILALLENELKSLDNGIESTFYARNFASRNMYEIFCTKIAYIFAQAQKLQEQIAIPNDLPERLIDHIPETAQVYLPQESILADHEMQALEDLVGRSSKIVREPSYEEVDFPVIRIEEIELLGDVILTREYEETHGVYASSSLQAKRN